MMPAALFGQAAYRTFYELSPLLPLSEWWHGLLLVGLCASLLGAAVWLYRRDAVELPRGVAVSLVLLRVIVLLGMLVFFLNPQQRTQQEVRKSPRVPVLVDTSSSMATRDAGDDSLASDSNQRRLDAVLDLLLASPSTTGLLDSLRQQYDVALYRFDEATQVEPVGTLPSVRREQTPKEVREAAEAAQASQLQTARQAAWIAVFAIAIAFPCGLIYAIQAGRRRRTGRAGRGRSLWLLAATLLVVSGTLGLGMADLIATPNDLRVLAGLREPLPPQLPGSSEVSSEVGTADASDADRAADADPETEADRETDTESSELAGLTRAEWSERLRPQGAQTRLGDALADLIRRERGRSIAGAVLFTDGQTTAGALPQDVAAAAVDAGLRLFPIGLGNPDPPREVRIVELQAPPRLFPQDRLPIRGVLQAFGFAGQTALVELYSRPAGSDETGRLEATQQVTLPNGETPYPVEFDLEAGPIGKREYEMVVVPQAAIDASGTDPSNATRRTVTVETIRRQNRVLLIAGGPNRDYRFLRNMLYRDQDTTLDVYLQTAQPGISQEADTLLTEFPRLKAELDEYDCIVAFDPDWTALDPTQARLLDTWIAEQAGGLVVVAGPVFTPEWTKRPRGDPVIDVLRTLYPVSFFNQRSASYGSGRFAGESPFPLLFTREGRAASFLWIADDPLRSEAVWEDFAGVYGYYGVNELKPGAVVFARFSDPQTAMGGELPVYLAAQFYGAGRVVFQASAEMWRLRAEDVDYFERYYTKLVHWAAQGRLLRDSPRGVLIADKTQCMQGDSITLQAILRDAQEQPWEQPQIEAIVTEPDGSTARLVLQGSGNEGRAGAFVTSYTPRSEGTYRVTLPLPDGGPDEALRLDFTVQLPRFEQQRPQRNDAALSALAESTGGYYFAGSRALLAADNKVSSETEAAASSLVAQIESGSAQLQSVFLPAVTKESFQQRLMMWLLIATVLFLALEWTLRRLHRLA